MHRARYCQQLYRQLPVTRCAAQALDWPASSKAEQLISLRNFSAAPSSSSTAATTRARAPVSFLSLGLTAGTGAGLLWFYNHTRKQKLEEARRKSAAVVGKAAIGGPFQLTDQHGQPFSDRDLRGRFALLYFGFTFCPDICPEELDKMSATIDHIEQHTKQKVQPVFISIDPERDSVEQVKHYVSEFHPRLIGLTGSPDKVDADFEVKEAARAYRVYYTKTEDSPTDYLVDHSIIMYLIDPNGEFVTFYGKNFSAEDMAKSIAQHVAQWKEDGQA